MWTTDPVNEINKHNCDFLVIPFDVNKGLMSMAWNKHLPHRHFFNYFLSKMTETGQMDRIIRKWKAKPRSDCGSQGEFVSMGIDNIISGFILLILGILLSNIILIMEMCFCKVLN